MVQDYCYLNEHTVKNNYPLPLISQLVDKLKGSKWFTKIDLRWGYNNVHIKEGDEWKAAFVCYWGSFEPVVMYFGLCNSPATFQTMMNEIFSDMDDVMVIYIHRWPHDLYQDGQYLGTWKDCKKGPKTTWRAWFFCRTRKMHFQHPRGGIPLHDSL